MECVQYSTLGTTFKFSKDVLNYFYFLGKNEEIADVSTEELTRRINNCGSLDVLVDKGNSIIEEVYIEILQQACDYIKEYKIYSVDIQILHKYCGQYTEELYDLFDEVYQEPYIQIAYDEKQAQEFRKARKQSRSRAVGFGYGISGYVSASMKAGAVNMATGMGHSLYNMMGNAVTKAGSAIQKNSIYKDKKRLEKIQNACISLVCGVMKESMCLINQLGESKIVPIDLNKQDAARAYLKNLINGSIPEEDRLKVLQKILQDDPISKDIYIYAIETYGDADGSLKKMSLDFGINLEEYVRKKIENEYGKVLHTNYTEEKEVLDLKREIQDRCVFYGVQPEEKYIDYLNKQWEEIDRKLRTAYNTEFITREEAQNYREDIDLFYKYTNELKFDEIDLLNEEVLSELTQKIRSLSYKGEFIQEKIQELLDDILQPYLVTQRIYNAIVTSNVPSEVGRGFIQENPIYQNLQKRISLSIVCNGKTRKITQNISRDEEVIFIQDCSIFGTWGTGIVCTDKRILMLIKNIFKEIPLNDVKKIEAKSQDIIIYSTTKEESYSILTMGMNNEQCSEWAKLFDDIVAGLRDVVSEEIVSESWTESEVTSTTQSSIDTNNEVITQKGAVILDKQHIVENLQERNYVFCTVCGKQIFKQANFCTYCGYINKYRG